MRQRWLSGRKTMIWPLMRWKQTMKILWSSARWYLAAKWRFWQPLLTSNKTMLLRIESKWSKLRLYCGYREPITSICSNTVPTTLSTSVKRSYPTTTRRGLKKSICKRGQSRGSKLLWIDSNAKNVVYQCLWKFLNLTSTGTSKLKGKLFKSGWSKTESSRPSKPCRIKQSWRGREKRWLALIAQQLTC